MDLLISNLCRLTNANLTRQTILNGMNVNPRNSVRIQVLFGKSITAILQALTIGQHLLT
jgi:hypothetical protein